MELIDMSDPLAIIIVGVLSLIGTLAGTYAGIRKSSVLTAYRIQSLEKKVDIHNQLIGRTYQLEASVGVIETKITGIDRSLNELKQHCESQTCGGR
jgi:tetrahydromethanopterin S-methyltransferase subunit F